MADEKQTKSKKKASGSASAGTKKSSDRMAQKVSKDTGKKVLKDTKRVKREPKIEIVEAEAPKKSVVHGKKKKAAPEHKVHIKPELGDSIISSLKTRDSIRKRRPKFRRQEWFRYKRLGTSWRKPRGIHSKARRNMKRRFSLVKIGFGTPSNVRGLHPSGFEEVIVFNVKQMWNVMPERQAVRIGGSVGARKRLSMIEFADEKGIRILNRNSVKLDRAIERIEENREED